MTTIEPTAAPPSRGGAGHGSTLAVTERRVLRSEWIKLRTVRSTVIGLAASAATLVGLGAVISAFATGQDDSGPSSSADALTTSLSGLLLAPLVVAVLGVLFVSSEYASGMIRVTLAAVRSRTSVLRAKSIVLAAVVFISMGVASMAAVWVGNAVYAGAGATYTLTDPGVPRVLVGAAAYAAGVSVLGVALGFVLRSAAGAIGVLVALLFVAPLMIQLVPGTIGDWISKLLPSNAGEAMTQLTASAGELSPWAGFAVFAGWVGVALVAAALVLRRRDA